MFTRRDVLLALALQCAAWPAAAQAPNSGTPKRVGILLGESPEDWLDYERGFLAAMREQGWANDKNLVIERAYADGKLERLAALADGLVRSRVDVIVTGGSPATMAAARATRVIPIVFIAPLPWVVEQGLIESYAHPGHNVTGAVLTDGDVIGKRLQFLRELVPTAKRPAWVWPDVLLSPETLSGGRINLIPVLRETAWKAGFETRFYAVRAGQDIAAVFDEVVNWGAQAVTAFAGGGIAELALRHKLPSAFPVRESVDAGGLLSYGAEGGSDSLLAGRSADYVDRILRGARPAELPVEFPTRYELAINVTTAKALRLSIPQALLLRAKLVQ